MARRQYAGAAVETVTTGTIPASGGGNVDIAATAGWPDGSTGPFSIVVDPGQANEEKILVSTLGGSTLTYTAGNRGWDSTASSAHASGAVVYLVAGALDFDEANAHHNATSMAHNATAIVFSPGGTVAATTVQAAIAEVAVDYATADAAVTTAYQAADTVLAARATAIEAAGWVTSSRIADGTIATVDIADGAVTSAKILLSNSQWTKSTTTVCAGGGAINTLTWTTEVRDDLSIAVPTFSSFTLGVGLWAITVLASPTTNPTAPSEIRFTDSITGFQALPFSALGYGSNTFTFICSAIASTSCSIRVVFTGTAPDISNASLTVTKIGSI